MSWFLKSSYTMNCMSNINQPIRAPITQNTTSLKLGLDVNSIPSMHSYHRKIFDGIYHTSTSQTKNKNPYRLNRAGLVSIDKRIWRIHQLLRSYTDRKWNQLVIFSDNGNLCIIWKQPSRCSRQTNGTHGRRGSLNHPSDQRAGYRTANWKLFKNYQQSTRLLSSFVRQYRRETYVAKCHRSFYHQGEITCKILQQSETSKGEKCTTHSRYKWPAYCKKERNQNLDGSATGGISLNLLISNI